MNHGIEESLLIIRSETGDEHKKTTFALTETEARLLFETLQNQRKEIIDENLDNMLT
ncbi:MULTISPECIES: hypothetical protein [Bacillaceae]|uniref:hypothetical protein n=1 Tax=Bacillaceae TaxID=186817 RepID=UPI0014052D8E|nr:hypothetical protein [Bacillus sp. CBEL-1]